MLKHLREFLAEKWRARPVLPDIPPPPTPMAEREDINELLENQKAQREELALAVIKLRSTIIGRLSEVGHD
jgi:hypothetical protein